MLMSTQLYDLIVQALDGKELFTIEGSENWRSTPDNWRSAKNAHPYIAAKPSLKAHRLVTNWKIHKVNEPRR